MRRKVFSLFATLLSSRGTMRRPRLLIAFVISFLAVVCSPSVAAGQGGTIRGHANPRIQDLGWRSKPASPFGYNGRYVYTRVELTGR
jgi:hypothetical protein